MIPWWSVDSVQPHSPKPGDPTQLWIFLFFFSPDNCWSWTDGIQNFVEIQIPVLTFRWIKLNVVVHDCKQCSKFFQVWVWCCMNATYLGFPPLFCSFDFLFEEGTLERKNNGYHQQCMKCSALGNQGLISHLLNHPGLSQIPKTEWKEIHEISIIIYMCVILIYIICCNDLINGNSLI